MRYLCLTRLFCYWVRVGPALSLLLGCSFVSRFLPRKALCTADNRLGGFWGESFVYVDGIASFIVGTLCTFLYLMSEVGRRRILVKAWLGRGSCISNTSTGSLTMTLSEMDSGSEGTPATFDEKSLSSCSCTPLTPLTLTLNLLFSGACELYINADRGRISCFVGNFETIFGFVIDCFFIGENDSWTLFPFVRKPD